MTTYRPGLQRKGPLTLSNSPHFFDFETVFGQSVNFVLLLAPVLLWASIVKGLPAFAMIAVCLLSGFLAHLAYRSGNVSLTVGDGRWLVSSLLSAALLPLSLPLPWAFVAVFLATILVNFTQGGSASRWLHPAAIAWLVAYIAWPHEFVALTSPIVSFAPQHATVEGHFFVNSWLGLNGLQGIGPGDIVGTLQASGPVDTAIRDFLNTNIFSALGSSLPGAYVDSFLGLDPVSLGGSNAAAILLVSVFIFGRGVASASVVGTGFLSWGVLLYAFGGLPFGMGLFTGDVLFFTLNGNFLFVLFFLLADAGTQPFSMNGRRLNALAFGILAALFTILSGGLESSIAAFLGANLFTLIWDELRHRGGSK